MRSGTISLPSGRWHWTILRQWTGSTVVYQHRERVHDEMRNWTPSLELTQEEAAELAKDPLERVWVDVDGLKWRLSIELPSTWRDEARGLQTAENGTLRLVFRRGGMARSADVPEDAHLGNFSNGELRELLEKAFEKNVRLRS